MAKKRSKLSDADKEANKFIHNLGKNYSLAPQELRFLKALIKANGNISRAHTAAGISRKTYYNWLNERESFREAVRETEEYRLDKAEEALGLASTIDWKAAKALLELRRPHGYNETLVIERARKQLPGGQGHVPLPRAVMAAEEPPARVREKERPKKKTGTEEE